MYVVDALFSSVATPTTVDDVTHCAQFVLVPAAPLPPVDAATIGGDAAATYCCVWLFGSVTVASEVSKL